MSIRSFASLLNTPLKRCIRDRHVNTTTAYVDAGEIRKRTERHQAAAASAKWSSLRKQAASIVKTTCACIGTTPACKSIVTKTTGTVPTITSV